MSTPQSPSTGDPASQPEQCMACRGTGKIISHLGGTPTTVTCPWCRGGGVRLADVDAQFAWLEGNESGGEPPQDPGPSGDEAA